MRVEKLEPKLRCTNYNGITLDPRPNWSLEELVSDLNCLELKQKSSGPIFEKTQPRKTLKKIEAASKISKPFVMRVSDDENIETEDEENQSPNLGGGKRFSCTDIYISDTDSSEDELALEETQAHMMEPVDLLEGLIFEREIEHQQLVQEDIRHRVALFETDLMNENERANSALNQIGKFVDARREMDRKIDTQYRRKIAEALDNHLSTVQRNHERKSQIEERKIRNDAEEAKRKQRALQEEKARKEKAKAEAESVERKAEETKREALEAERRIAKEAAEKKDNETTKIVSELKAHGIKTDGNAEVSKEIKYRGIMVRAAERALKMEEERLHKYSELVEKNQALRLSSNNDFRQYEVLIGRHIRQIAGTRENVRTRATELIKIMKNPQCPQSISIAVFAKKVVSQCATLGANIDSTAFACGQVIVLVTSEAPLAMDILIAELHRACIYTIPKYKFKSEESGLNKEDYLKELGYREEDGKIETTEQYLGRVESYMKLYGALVQTEIHGVRNLHGLEQGWAWLARFLNALPANMYTAVALDAFLKMAGFGLMRRYKSQFRKILNLISSHFLRALETRGDPKLNPVLLKIRTYIETNQFLKEPEGWQLQTSLLSDVGVPDTDSGYYQNQYYNQQNRW